MTSTSTATEEAPAPDGQPDYARPYQGGRAQAESGSRIIQNDFDAWSVVFTPSDATLPAGHPRVQQLAHAWQAVARYGLGDEPDTAAIRYQVLSHAAYALAEVAGRENRTAEVTALERLADHAGKHAARLRATGEDLFLRSGKAGPYDGGRGQAAIGSLIVERDYRTWDASAASAQAAGHTLLWGHTTRLQQSWAEIRRDGLADGPGPASARYCDLAAACDALADDFTADMPSAALGDLLQVGQHARKHAVRLGATAASYGTSGQQPETAERAADRNSAADDGTYQGLPDSVAAVSASGHSAVPQEQASRAEGSRSTARRGFRQSPELEQER
jgi:hypothetical protein